MAGREFDLPLMAMLADDLTDDMLLDVLEEGLDARVIEELPAAVGRYQFTHALIQETLSDELSLPRRVRLHARIANALEELRSHELDAHAAALAHHYAQAETVHGVEKLVRYSIMAGDKALSNYAYEEALSHFQRVLATKDELMIDEEVASILPSMARAHAALSQDSEAVSSIIRAFEYYEEIGDVARAVAVVENAHSVWLVRGLSGVLSRAVLLAPPDHPQSTGRLLSTYGFSLGATANELEPAQEMLQKAIDLARQDDDTALEMRALAIWGHVCGLHLRWGESRDRCLQALELADQVDESNAELRALRWTVNSLSALGQPDDTLVHSETSLGLSERLRDNYWRLQSLNGIARLSYAKGDFEQVRKVTERVLTLDPQDQAGLAVLMMLEYETGNFSAGEHYLNRLLGLAPRLDGFSNPVGIALIARIVGEVEFLQHFDGPSRTPTGTSDFPPAFELVAVYIRAWRAVQLGDAEMAQQTYATLARQSGTMMVGPVGTAFSIDRLLGLLAFTIGNLKESQTHFDEALEFCRNAGYVVELAWALCDYADMRLERDGDGNTTKATNLLDESLQISSDLGMRPLMERVLSRREILKA